MKKSFDYFIPINPFSLDITIQHIGIEKRKKYDLIHNKLSYYVLEYVYSGEGVFIVNNKSFTIGKNSLFFIPTKTVTHTISNKSNPLKFYYIAFYGINCASILSKAGFNDENAVIKCEDGKILGFFKKIYNLSFNDSINNYIDRQIQFLSMLKLLIEKSDVAEPFIKKQDFHVKNVQGFIHKNYAEPINVSIIADSLHMDRTYLSKIFKQYYSISIIDYLIRYRLEKAMFLLTSTNDKITDIAIKCGFTDNKSFYIRFKQKNHCSPKQYRAWNKSPSDSDK